MTLKDLVRAAVLAGGLAAGSAFAQAAKPGAVPPDPMSDNAAALSPAGDTASEVAFAYADRDEDVLISWEEYRNRAMRVFGHADGNRDGVLQVAELKILDGAAAAPPKADVDLATFNAALRKAFDVGDKNGDGVLTPIEWRAAVRPSKLF